MESNHHREPWNKGKSVGQKPPLKPKDTGPSESTFRTRIRFDKAIQKPPLASVGVAPII